MSKKQSLTGRAITSLILLVGYYVFAIAIAIGLAYIPIAEYQLTNHVIGKIALFCFVGAATILWSLVPKIVRFTAPGPLLKENEHPKLFKVIEEMAIATNQPKPSEVYLDLDVNAWVGQRGGFMGIGGTRIMGIGLPLLKLLSISEFKGVIAHEFGHYHSGDTKLGPLIFKTRQAIQRTLEGLEKRSQLLQKPFIWYGNMFLRITHSISRNQEFVADELAAKIVGPAPLISGLQKISGAGSVFNSYWIEEVAPVLDAGMRPPFAEGFTQFLSSTKIKALTEQSVQNELAAAGSPYDTHPPLGERLHALSKLQTNQNLETNEPAISLIEDINDLETKLFVSRFGEQVKDLKPIDWEQVGLDFYLPSWEAIVHKHAEEIKGITPGMVPGLLKHDGGNLIKRLLEAHPDLTDNIGNVFYHLILSCLNLTLLKKGWDFHSGLGEPISFSKDDFSIEPNRLFSDLYTEEITGEQWDEVITSAGIFDFDFGRLFTAVYEIETK